MEWIILITIFILAFVLFEIAKKMHLKCQNCNSKNVVATGINRKRDKFEKSPIRHLGPRIEKEYKCSDCNKIFYSSAENIFDLKTYD